MKSISSSGFLILFFCLSLLSGCATREEIARRELLQKMAVEMESAQRTNSDNLIRIAEIEERIGLVSGKIEETAHREGQNYQNRLSALEEKNKIFEEQTNHTINRMEKLEKEVDAVNASLNSQKKYLEEILSTLASITGKKNTSKVSAPKASSSSPYEEAMESYQKGRYDTAKAQLLDLVDSKSIKGNQKARVLHNLGMIEYIRKSHENSMTYFSRMITDFPKSPYNPNGLLHIGKALNAMGKKEEAKQAWNELIKQFPKSKHVKTAKQLLEGK